MDKVTKTTKTIEDETITHKFYCDECGAFLGESEECDDGYYDQIGKCIWETRDGCGKWMIKRGNYCSKCESKVKERVVSGLKKLGFKKIGD